MMPAMRTSTPTNRSFFDSVFRSIFIYIWVVDLEMNYLNLVILSLSQGVFDRFIVRFLSRIFRHPFVSDDSVFVYNENGSFCCGITLQAGEVVMKDFVLFDCLPCVVA